MAHNPVDTVKSAISGQGSHQVAANIAAKEISHGEDVELLRSEDRVKNAGTEAETRIAVHEFDGLMQERQSMFVRWTMDRHVTKLRRLPLESFEPKTAAQFRTMNSRGEDVMDWSAYRTYQLQYYSHQYGGQYIGYGSNPPAPSKESIMPCLERVIIASAPLQELIMTSRRVYRWENRGETIKYIIIYLTLWTFDLLAAGILSALLYFVVERRVHGRRMQDLRDDVIRTEDVNQTAMTLTEFVEKRGDENWADELMQDLGPWLMLQLCDAANFFEAMRNFYEWRVPGRTLVTLSIFVAAILTASFVPTWLLVRTFTLSAGISFFALFPIGTNFPEYRLLVSPFKRVLWNIPTQAEWSIKSLQARGRRYEQASSNETALGEKSPDFGTYTAHHNSSRGKLSLAPTAIIFTNNIGHKIHFTIPYAELDQLEKIDRTITKNIPSSLQLESGKDIKIVGKDQRELVLENVNGRDQAFSQIVGFSDVKWQVVW
ncbi:hypothetical protein BDV96DRAFT_573204 [Lophiotrema nucula]|uniref:Uncharacterized protein n=1 Tax=Lophiotrema nucula TaxID=690887 RepID=A0A6A5ZAV0_9PLEO|nr:hypothetical protein BDV96DRAFT_573204 [Lophiotrema nucula]